MSSWREPDSKDRTQSSLRPPRRQQPSSWPGTVPDGYINKVSLVDSTSAAYKAADEWHDQNPGWKVTR